MSEAKGIHVHPSRKLGRKPPKRAATLSASDFITLPPRPIVDPAPDLAWPMDRNDQAGCCLIEGTEVGAANVTAGHRVRYDGPVVSLRLASGKHLTVTPNHAVLTPRGFVRARFLQEGDDLIGARWADQVASGLAGQDGDEAVTPVEEVFAALHRSAARSGEATQARQVVTAVDFHGDARYFHGDVDVVRAHGFLRREVDSPLSQPHGEDQVGPAGQLKGALHGAGTTLQRPLGSPGPTNGGVGGGRDLGPLSDGHGGVAQAETLTLRPYGDSSFENGVPQAPAVHARLSGQIDVGGLTGGVTVDERPKIRRPAGQTQSIGLGGRASLVAGSVHPSSEGGTTDPQLPGYLFERFPGFVEADRVVDVEILRYVGHVYDLSTETRWYVANGVIAHNCVVAAGDHALQAIYSLLGEHRDNWTDGQLLAFYRTQNPDFRSWADGGSSADGGMDVQTFLEHLVEVGEILAFGAVDLTEEALKAAVYVGLGVITGEQLDVAQQNQAVWDFVAGSPTWGGHATTSVAYDPDTQGVVTWGELVKVTDRFVTEQMQEAWFVLTAAHLRHPGFRDSFDLAGFSAAVAELTNGKVVVPVDPPPAPAPGDPLADFPFASVDDWARHPHVFRRARLAAGQYKAWRARHPEVG